MVPLNRYYKCSKLSEVKFRYLLRLFALDLTASDAARWTGLSVRSVNDVYLLLRRRLPQLCPVPVELGGALELDESYFGPRRVRGKRGRGQVAKRLSLVCSSAGGRCTRKLCRIARKRCCKASFGAKSTPPRWSIPMAGVATTGWWMWVLTAPTVSTIATTNLCSEPPISTASSRSGASPKTITYISTPQNYSKLSMLISRNGPASSGAVSIASRHQAVFSS